MPIDLTQGALIGGRYRLDHLLGEGGMGAVWAATHLVTRKHVALKFLKAAGAQRPDTVRRFLREARAASAVNHPNVVQIHDIMEGEDGLPVMIMDLLVGESLGDKLHREGRVGARVAQVLVPVISALGTAHALGIVHRDLKPDNIFLVKLPDGRVDPEVLDFGIAKLTAEEGDAAKTAGLTQTGSMLGTPYYMSPEQAFGEKNVDQRADVWAMGVILYQCLSGKRPVTGENLGQLFRVLMSGEIVPLRRVAPDVPDDLCALVDRMLVTDRARRLPDLREALEVLRRHTDVAGLSFDAPAAPIADEVSHAQTGAGPAAPPSAKGSSLASAPTVEAPAAAEIGATGAGGTVVMTPSVAAPAPAPAATHASTGAPLAATAERPKRTGPMVTAGVIAALLAGGGVAWLTMSGGGEAAVTPEAATPSATLAAAPASAPAVTPAPSASAADPAPSAAPAASSASAAPIAGRPPAGRPAASTAGTASTTATQPATKPSSTALPGGVVGDVPF